MPNSEEELGPISKVTHRKIGFKDYAGVRDRAGRILNLMRVDGKMFSPFGEEYLRNVKSIKIRPDDIFLCGYAKTGCHWMWEIMTMILKGKPEYAANLKLTNFVDLASPEVYNAAPSPRILNTHIEYDWLPDEARQKRTKILLTVRNVKDTAVSMYNHHVNLKEVYNYDGSFNDWFDLFRNGTVDNGDYFEYYKSWDQAIKDHPDHPILVVKYEDAKSNLAAAVRTIANFMEVKLTNEQVDEIARAGEFGNMKKEFKGKATEGLVRKGEVGDWNNWLTEEQRSELDRKSQKFLTGTPFETLDCI